jgi:hypothetical protein
MKNYEKILNQNKNYNLIHDNFIFNAETRKNKTNGWWCKDKKCQVVGSISKEDVFEIIGVHVDSNSFAYIEKQKALNVLKENALKNGYQNIKTITEVTKKLNEETLQCMPKFKSLNDMCTRVKNKVFNEFDQQLTIFQSFYKKI